MPLRSEELALSEGRVIKVTQLPAMRAVKLAARIGKLVGPALAAAMDKGADANVDVGVVARVLFDRIDPDELEKLLRELFATTTRGDGSGRTVPLNDVFDFEFAGDGLADLLKVVQFALGVQFGTFGSALRAVGSAVMPKTAPHLSPVPTSNDGQASTKK